MHIVVFDDRRCRRLEEAGAAARAIGRIAGRIVLVVGGRGARAGAVAFGHGDRLGHEMVHQNPVGVDAGFRRRVVEYGLIQTGASFLMAQ
jgi:hypothetical protein